MICIGVQSGIMYFETWYLESSKVYEYEIVCAW